MADRASTWHFLSNHAHVLLSLAADSDLTVRELSQRVGITERAVMRIISDLDEAGYLDRVREGRRNHYILHPELPLRHPVEAHCSIGDLIEMFERGLGET
jgi:DNA-binding transcriptional ArsR family regulator